MLLCRDHPRVCGEKLTPWQSRLRSMGSPPRVRGKDPRVCGEKLSLWITPACAGKSGHGGVQDGVTVDHPRVCGEKTKKIP